MGLFTLLRFLTPNGTVSVSEAGTDLTTTAALGQAVENLDTYALRLNGTNALTSAGTIDASLASDTTGLKAPSKAGAAPTAAGNVAFDSTAGGLVFGDGANTVGLTGMKRLGDTTLGIAATNITFSGIPGTYKHLRLVVSGRSDRAANAQDALDGQFNTDTAANYNEVFLEGVNSVVSTGAGAGNTSLFLGHIAAATAAANVPGVAVIDIPDYASTTFYKAVWSSSGFADNTTAASDVITFINTWRSTAAITSIKLFPNAGTNLIAGTRATLYGLM